MRAVMIGGDDDACLNMLIDKLDSERIEEAGKSSVL
jgi:hypothetical protein